jgi:hypothetical protein
MHVGKDGIAVIRGSGNCRQWNGIEYKPDERRRVPVDERRDVPPGDAAGAPMSASGDAPTSRGPRETRVWKNR